MLPDSECSAEPRPADGAVLDIESPRLDAIVDYLLGYSHNSVIDRDCGNALIADHPHLPRLAATAATWDRTAAHTMLARGLRRFLILGTGGFPIWAGSSTLADLHDAGAQIVVIEHDLITRHLHTVIDHGAAADRANVLHLPAHRHHDIAAELAVARLLTGPAPLGILATGLLRPASIPLAVIVALLDAAPAGSLAAISQLTASARGDECDTHAGGLAARNTDDGGPIAVEDADGVDRQLRDLVHLADGCGLPFAAGSDGAGLSLRVALVARTRTRAGHPDQPGDAEPRPDAPVPSDRFRAIRGIGSAANDSRAA
ncbi:SAM-dependent methyltransferase [Amycolatopsis sp. lyj-23]|uniref:SAM-dependent methyltransferase n=1 Tax=Amycolatopsis sp. lyj-23 TaxID=2789283 RepID=UPI00397D8F83